MDMLFGVSDYDTSTETSDSEDQDDNDSLFGGWAWSILSSLDESISKVDNFLSLQRGFAHGDIVCSIVDPKKQLGRVVDVQIFVDLESRNGELLKGIDSKNLCQIRSFDFGDYVVLGPWLGRVEKVFDLVTVLFNDGTKCEIMLNGAQSLIPVFPCLNDDGPYTYSPGQRVRLSHPKEVFKPMKWLCGSWNTVQEEAVVCHVEVGTVQVEWIASVATGGRDGNYTTSFAPSILQSPKVLTLLSCFSNANWQLGDWCCLRSDYLHNPLNSYLQSHSPKCFNNQKCNIGDGDCYQKMFFISRTRTKLDVQWENGEKSLGLDPQMLYPVTNIGEHDFFPEQLVLRKVITDDEQILNNMESGIVRYVDVGEQTARVKWVKSEPNRTVDFPAELNEETVSTYELMEHPDFAYCIGDIVVKNFPFLVKSKKVSVKENSGEGWSEEVSDYLSYIGNVVGWNSGALEVKWASGSISKVHPSEIFGLDRLYNPPEVVEEINENNPSKNMSEQDRASSLVEKKVLDDSNHVFNKVANVGGALSFPNATINFLKLVAKSLFGSNASISSTSAWEEVLPVQVLKNYEEDDQNWEKSSHQEVDDESPAFPIHTEESSAKFEKFGVVFDYTDHHFLNGAGNIIVSTPVKNVFLKKLHQEWSILERDLPDGIYVRVYEERMDLLRAAIVGAKGTPYQDGLFFFDILLPSDYPHEPPVVHYHSGGLRLNPNLYESGKVCLSLLKTWTGIGSEVWNPETSSILQVLVSLQALVLNEKPYFNEAGYDNQVGSKEGERNSATYNENAYILTLKSMLYILRNPPKHFETLVEDHFTRRGKQILGVCRACKQDSGDKLGLPSREEEEGEEDRKGCSMGFKIMIGKLTPKLTTAFAELGVDI